MGDTRNTKAYKEMENLYDEIRGGKVSITEELGKQIESELLKMRKQAKEYYQKHCCTEESYDCDK